MNCPRIEFASQLVDGVKHYSEFVALIQHVSKLVYIIANDITQQDLDKFSTVLNSGTEDRWVSNTDVPSSRFRIVMAATTIDIPKVCISPGLIWSKPDLQPPGMPALTYLFLVQGKNASERTKVVSKPTRDGAAAAMLHEVSTPFDLFFPPFTQILSRTTCSVGHKVLLSS